MSWYAATLLQKESLCHPVLTRFKYPSSQFLLGIRSSPVPATIGRLNRCGRMDVEEAAIYANAGAPYLKSAAFEACSNGGVDTEDQIQ